ncbi:MAG: diaminopimelate epimerase [Deltaproteobacteria bacterium]|nr:diaminopimelate epimerase [Deltaproteobacteria bacterium]
MSPALRLPFRKVHGIGNDFVFADLRGDPGRMTPALARELCHRTLGVGADGVLILTGTVAEPEMTVWNADGSRAEMCGNGIRCVVMELVRGLGATANPVVVGTGAGPRECRWEDRGGEGFHVEVDMGPGHPDGDDVELQALAGIEGDGLPVRPLRGVRVSMGNPHVVFFDRFDPREIRAWGPRVTASPAFPGGVNAEFATLQGPRRVDLVVHERGAGFTQGCGTGACAVVAAGVRTGLLPPDETVAVALPGGRLEIRVRSSDGHLLMTGPAVEVFEGCVLSGAVPFR